MTFRELANELMDHGWRCYYIPSMDKYKYLHAFCKLYSIEVRVYEGKSLIFVKDSKPIEDDSE